MSGECGLIFALIYNEFNYAPLGGDHYAVPVCDNDRR